jgi:hypothetical protein
MKGAHDPKIKRGHPEIQRGQVGLSGAGTKRPLSALLADEANSPSYPDVPARVSMATAIRSSSALN